MERMVNTRMTWYLDKNNILKEKQAAFRRGRCTEEQITLIAQNIEDGFQEKRHTVVVWIDIWRKLLTTYRETVCYLNLRTEELVEQYLQNRKARVRTQNFKSRTQNMKHGVPQDGILSPTLFSMFMNDIQTIIPKGVNGALFADDMAIWATEEYTGTAQARLQPNSKQYASRLEKTNCEKSHP
ncbi:RNA-directed DNA polymerase from [Elysia marginata]|uniref:RNA-directed DNA polymerase from n=1 Tax=Elysia marginata TaxID=1093978 RepID=A0AAV4HM71_9GAST|nr:RNA-directed DNA polymerase from [Elysia marginata]